MKRKGKRGLAVAAPGFTAIELALVIAIVGILAVAAISRLVDFSSSTQNTVEKGEVAAIQSGIKLYGAESQVKARVPIFPSSLDGAAPGPSSPANELFTAILTEGLKRIDLYAFDSNQLTEVVLPSSLEIIEMRAFSGNSITKVTIGSGVSIGDNAFGNSNAFRDAYATGGQGTYSLVDGVWSKSAPP